MNINSANELRKLGSLLSNFTSQLNASGVVDEGSLSSLYDQASAMKLYANKNRNKQTISWNFVVAPNKPLIFKHAEGCKGIRPDIFCSSSFSFNPEISITRLNTVIRLWSASEERAFREKLDSDSLKALLAPLGWRRVMLRMHFDYLSESSLPAPVFHMQIGGRENGPTEFCWFPQDLDVPRLLCLPVDFFGACEIVMANFFPSKFFKLSKDGRWNKAIKWSEKGFVEHEIKHFLKSIPTASSILRNAMPDRR